MFCESMQSHIAAARAESGPHNPMGRIRIKIRRDHIIEDALAQLNEVSADALKGTVMKLTSLDSECFGSFYFWNVFADTPGSPLSFLISESD